MPQSLARVVLHIVFSTKNRVPFLKAPVVQQRLHAYIAGLFEAFGLGVVGYSAPLGRSAVTPPPPPAPAARPPFSPSRPTLKSVPSPPPPPPRESSLPAR